MQNLQNLKLQIRRHISVAIKNWHYLIGLLVFAFILLKINAAQALTYLLSVDKAYFIASAALSFPIFFLRGLRWRYLMGRQGIAYGTKPVTSMYFSALYIGLVTPGRVAELARLMYLKRDGHSLGKALFSVVFDRLFDAVALAAFAMIGLLLFTGTLKVPAQTVYTAMLVLVAVTLLLAVLLLTGLFKRALMVMLGFLFFKKLGKAARASVTDFLGGLSIFNIKTVAVAAGFTLASALLYYLQAYLLTAAVGFKISFFYLVFAVSVATFAALAPVSILGIGTRDAAFLYLFQHAGISNELAITYSALVFANILVLAGVCAVSWFRNPVPIIAKKTI